MPTAAEKPAEAKITAGSMTVSIPRNFWSPAHIRIARRIPMMPPMSKKIGGSSRQYFQKQQALLGQLNGNIEETIGGLKEVKVFNHEEEMKRGFYEINENFRGAATKANFYAGVIMAR